MKLSLSIIIPVYNEVKTLPVMYDRLQRLSLERPVERIYVDDGSTDGSQAFLLSKNNGGVEGEQFLFHDKNQGKGAAIKTGLAFVHGDYVLIQDADLEYDPEDIWKLIDRAEREHLLVVYGSRNKGIRNQYTYLHYYWGGRLLTSIFNLFFHQSLSDLNTCYKLVARNLMMFIQLKENGFSIDGEISAKIARLGVPIVEESIQYTPRRFSEGKKIRAHDGIGNLRLFLPTWHAIFTSDRLIDLFDSFARGPY